MMTFFKYSPSDNDGTVIKCAKGYDLKCCVSDCLIRASNYIAVQLQAKAYVVNVRRCSSLESSAADSISKCEWKRLDQLMPHRDLDPRPIPRSFVKWMEAPTDDWDLGPKVMKDLLRMYD